MTRREKHFTNVLRSRGVGLLIALAGVWMLWHALQSGRVPTLPGGNSYAIRLPGVWFGAAETLSFALSVTGLFATAGVMVRINRQFNLLRTMSVFFTAFFIFISCSIPVATSRAGVPVLLALVVMVCVWLMFSVYATRASSRRVFLVFTLLSAGGLIDYGFLLYVPVFLVGLGQMKLFRFKKLLAALLGLVTPLWIVYGLGLADSVSIPYIFFTSPSLLRTLPGGIPFVASIGFSIVTGIMLGGVNLFRILGFNARARAYNGLMSLVAISTVVFAIINFSHIWLYVPLLCVAEAFQVGLFFRYFANRRGYIPVLCLMGAYVALYLWQLSM